MGVTNIGVRRNERVKFRILFCFCKAKAIKRPNQNSINTAKSTKVPVT